jgi:hypothetical protein
MIFTFAAGCTSAPAGRSDAGGTRAPRRHYPRFKGPPESESGGNGDGMRKLACYCDRCTIPAEWSLRPSQRNVRFFDHTVSCHGEAEQFLVSALELLYPRDPATGREVETPLYVIAFEGAEPCRRVRLIMNDQPYLSIRIKNPTNRLMGE